MADINELIEAKRAADAALADAEAGVLDELVAAKDAYRTDPSEGNRTRKAAAVSAIQYVREVQRTGRATHAVGGDAVASTPAPAETPGSEG